MLDTAKVTYLENLRYPSSEVKTIGEIFDQIKSNRFEKKTRELNILYHTNKELYSIKKRDLPVVAFCGVFNPHNRKKEGILSYNKLLILDIDKLKQDEISIVKKQLLDDECLAAIWMSPSNMGIKGILDLDFNDIEINEKNVDFHHKRAFKKASEYFFEKYHIKLDQSGCDYTRLCFISWDEHIVIKAFYKKFELLKSDFVDKPKTTKNAKSTLFRNLNNTNKHLLNYSIGKNSASDRRQMLKIIKYLEKNNKSITYLYENWLRIALAISNTFTFDIGIDYFIRLSRLDVDKFDKEECINLLKHCYYNSKGVINFSTIVHLAKEKNFR